MVRNWPFWAQHGGVEAAGGVELMILQGGENSAVFVHFWSKTSAAV